MVNFDRGIPDWFILDKSILNQQNVQHIDHSIISEHTGGNNWENNWMYAFLSYWLMFKAFNKLQIIYFSLIEIWVT